MMTRRQARNVCFVLKSVTEISSRLLACVILVDKLDHGIKSSQPQISPVSATPSAVSSGCPVIDRDSSKMMNQQNVDANLPSNSLSTRELFIFFDIYF